MLGGPEMSIQSQLVELRDDEMPRAVMYRLNTPGPDRGGDACHTGQLGPFRDVMLVPNPPPLERLSPKLKVLDTEFEPFRILSHSSHMWTQLVHQVHEHCKVVPSRLESCMRQLLGTTEVVGRKPKGKYSLRRAKWMFFLPETISLADPALPGDMEGGRMDYTACRFQEGFPRLGGDGANGDPHNQPRLEARIERLQDGVWGPIGTPEKPMIVWVLPSTIQPLKCHKRVTDETDPLVQEALRRAPASIADGGVTKDRLEWEQLLQWVHKHREDVYFDIFSIRPKGQPGLSNIRLHPELNRQFNNPLLRSYVSGRAPEEPEVVQQAQALNVRLRGNHGTAAPAAIPSPWRNLLPLDDGGLERWRPLAELRVEWATREWLGYKASDTANGGLIRRLQDLHMAHTNGAAMAPPFPDPRRVLYVFNAIEHQKFLDDLVATTRASPHANEVGKSPELKKRIYAHMLRLPGADLTRAYEHEDLSSLAAFRPDPPLLPQVHYLYAGIQTDDMLPEPKPFDAHMQNAIPGGCSTHELYFTHHLDYALQHLTRPDKRATRHVVVCAVRLIEPEVLCSSSSDATRFRDIRATPRNHIVHLHVLKSGQQALSNAELASRPEDSGSVSLVVCHFSQVLPLCILSFDYPASDTEIPVASAAAVAVSADRSGGGPRSAEASGARLPAGSANDTRRDEVRGDR